MHNYPYSLEGLRIIPFGLYLIFLACWQFWLHILFGENTLFFIAPFVALILLAFLIDHIYQKKAQRVLVDDVSPRDSMQRRGALLLFFFLYLLGTAIDITGHLPISVLGAAVGVVVVLYWYQRGQTPIFLLIAALLLIVISVLPAFLSGVFPLLLRPYLSFVQLCIGLLLIMSGIQNHVAFMHVLKSS